MDKDALVIQALRQNGSNLSKPHEIDFFLDFESLGQAAPVARAMDANGYEIRMFENDDKTVTIEAKKSVVPELATMQSIGRFLNELTDEHGGKYDGWGAEIVE